MLFGSSAPQSHHEVLQQYTAQYDARIKSGEYEPFVYPWGTFGAAVVILYLLIDHRDRPFLRRSRYLVWAFNVGFSAYCIRYCRARSMVAGFGIGLVSAWSILWTATILIVHDAQMDFRRIERTDSGVGQTIAPQQYLEPFDESSNGHANGSASQTKGLAIKRRRSRSGSNKFGTRLAPAQRKGAFAWQSYPVAPFIERLDWVADVFCNFRGMGWNWRISGLAPAPKWVQEELRNTSGTEVSDKDTHTGKDGTHRYHTKHEVLRANVKAFIINYLIMDLMKVFIVHDPYFWGQPHLPPPSWYPAAVRASPLLLRVVRLALTLFAVKSSLLCLFTLAPLFFVGVLGPKVIGARGEPWMYPDTWGSYRNVFDKGLTGWWGGWWHQTFRFAFESPPKRIVTALGMNPKSLAAKGLQLFIAFALSGSLHACGSFTMAGQTSPLSGPFSFFVLQACGIIGQLLLTGMLRKTGVTQRMPKRVRQAANFIYVHLWFLYIAPLLCDDFAKGGIWMYEPFPISLLRGLGLGGPENGWWCWGGEWLRWHTGQHWWQSGISM
ncbi:hypothetical protein W97_05201 [Coniosporium apollinis CBS 100218]|uniref:Wax synthase domain-containing protein n=1 Tax=Coniosporium apollinis (strain CBS 100218) TaxID=1168221 RepID=R7YVX0_CONA1|nr:uncharacterized protein W97_05201 [Coniosporium apollinis CBS 100218]EON65959.1 hypothetical protein W97_05201 [Coniosporium apollinis CBS 100218]